MAKRKKYLPQEINLNLTSMLDIVFQLIVFFLLVTNFTSAELPKLKPPVADGSNVIKDRNKLTVNVIPHKNANGESDGSGRAQYVRVGGENIDPGDYGKLTLLLKTEQAKADASGKPVEIDLRADASVHYVNVQPVMDAITNAGIGRINLVALKEEPR